MQALWPRGACDGDCKQGCSEPVGDKRRPSHQPNHPSYPGYGTVSSPGSALLLLPVGRTGRWGHGRNVQRSRPGLSPPA